MNRLHFDGPINPLSMGNVCFNFLRELHARKAEVSLFPTQSQANFEPFDKADPKLIEWIKEKAYKRFTTLDKNIPTLKVWHINGSENRIAPKQFLYTFYEVDSPTVEEIALVKHQEHVFFSSSESAEIFRSAGCDNVSFVPLGFDRDFFKTDKKYFDDGTIHFGLVGKLEKRKNTQEIIQVWLQKYGNNPKYQLTCLINNPFFKPEDMEEIVRNVLQNKRWTNINFLPFLKTNSEVNDLTNSIDIDLSGCNFNEGWNLPSFNSACLGNICIVGMGMGHKDWAQGDNIIPLLPQGKKPCYDGVFFLEGAPFNQGSFYNVELTAISEAMDRAVEKFENSPKKPERKDLQEQFSYKKSVDMILEKML